MISKLYLQNLNCTAKNLSPPNLLINENVISRLYIFGFSSIFMDVRMYVLWKTIKDHLKVESKVQNRSFYALKI